MESITVQSCEVDMEWVSAFKVWNTEALKRFSKETTGRNVVRPDVRCIPSDDPKYLEYLDKERLLMAKHVEASVWFEYILLVLAKKGFVRVLKALEGVPQYQTEKNRITFNFMALAPKETVSAFLQEYPEWTCIGSNMVTVLSTCRNLEVLDLLYERLRPNLNFFWIRQTVSSFIREGNLEALFFLIKKDPERITRDIDSAFVYSVSGYPHEIPDEVQLRILREDILTYDFREDDPVLNSCCVPFLLEVIRSDRVKNLITEGIYEELTGLASLVAKRNNKDLILACVDTGHTLLLPLVIGDMRKKAPSELLLDLINNDKFKSYLNKFPTAKSHFSDVVIAARNYGLLIGCLEATKGDVGFRVDLFRDACRNRWEKAILLLLYGEELRHKMDMEDVREIFSEALQENYEIVISHLGNILYE